MENKRLHEWMTHQIESSVLPKPNKLFFSSNEGISPMNSMNVEYGPVQSQELIADFDGEKDAKPYDESSSWNEQTWSNIQWCYRPPNLHRPYHICCWKILSIRENYLQGLWQVAGGYSCVEKIRWILKLGHPSGPEIQRSTLGQDVFTKHSGFDKL